MLESEKVTLDDEGWYEFEKINVAQNLDVTTVQSSSLTPEKFYIKVYG